MYVVEEILHTSKAHWLSDDSKLLAYVQFNDSSVPLEKFPIYSQASNMYTTFMQVPYPKVGASVSLALLIYLVCRRKFCARRFCVETTTSNEDKLDRRH